MEPQKVSDSTKDKQCCKFCKCRLTKTQVKEWVRLVFTGVVEIAALLILAANVNSYLIYQNMAMHNICLVKIWLPDNICRDLIAQKNETISEKYADEFKEIQEIFIDAKFYRSIVDNLFPVFYVIFAGPWSDHFGRKIPLMLPVIGCTLQAIVYLIMSFYIDTMNPYLLTILASLPRSLTGGEIAYAMAAYSYIADITPHSTRTVRHGILNAAYTVGVPVGFSISGRLIREGVGYAPSFAISIAFSAVGLVILIIFAKNVTKAGRIREGEDCGDLEVSKNLTWYQALNPKNNLIKVAALPFRKRADGGRTKLLMIFVAFIFSAAPIYGEFGVIFPYVLAKIGWSAVNYGDFSTFNTLIGVAGVILSMGIFSKWLKFSDPLVGFIAGISQMSGSILYSFATTGAMMYIASSIDSMNGTMVVIARSMMSKVVDPSEIGTLFSLVAILETLTPLAMDPTYAKLYGINLRNGHWLGWIFILSAGLTVPPQLVYLWLFIKNLFSGEAKTKDSIADSAPTTDTDGLSSYQSSPHEDNSTIKGLDLESKLNGGHTNPAFSSEESANEEDFIEVATEKKDTK